MLLNVGLMIHKNPSLGLAEPRQRCPPQHAGASDSAVGHGECSGELLDT